MNAETFLDGRVVLHGGDCMAVLKTLPAASVDSVVTDPPYHLTSIVKRFGGRNAAPARSGKTGAFARASKGFMGKTWDGGDIAFRAELWAEVARVLKPGGHLVAFGGTRGHHRMWSAIEDAGFDIRDTILDLFDLDPLARTFLESLDEAQRIAFLQLLERSGFGGMLARAYGSGFPKSHDVSKAIDRTAGAQRSVVGPNRFAHLNGKANVNVFGAASRPDETVPATEAARQWQGWGSALKPAWEPICLARKPLDGTIAANVLAYGVGGLNVLGCQIGETGGRNNGRTVDSDIYGKLGPFDRVDYGRGRFPANLVHDGSAAVEDAFGNAPGQQRALTGEERAQRTLNAYGEFGASRHGMTPRGDAGSAARFFYSAKADSDDRLGSNHATVKPVDLIRWLVRLVTPKGGLVLDPFAGSGTTGEAAIREGCRAVLIELEAAHRVDIARRMDLALAGPTSRRLGAAKAKAARSTPDDGPLFGGADRAESGAGGSTACPPTRPDDRADGTEEMNEAAE